MRYIFSNRVAWVNDDDEFLLINYETEKVAVFSNTSADIVRHISTGLDIEDIVDIMICRYKGNDDVIRKDINDFIVDLMQRGYISEETEGL